MRTYTTLDLMRPNDYHSISTFIHHLLHPGIINRSLWPVKVSYPQGIVATLTKSAPSVDPSYQETQRHGTMTNRIDQIPCCIVSYLKQLASAI